MRSAFVWVFVGLVGCTKVAASQDPAEPPDEQPQFAQAPPGAKMPPPPTPPTPPTPAPPPKTAAPKVTIGMTSATLADDCGTAPIKAKAKRATHLKGDMADDGRRGARARRACEQSSMQISVKSDASGAAVTLSVKKVELFDDKGKRLGELTPRDPGAWAQDGTYKPWDQSIAPGTELSVSYALSQPPWGTVTERWNRTYVLKAVITVGGTDQAVQHQVHIEAPTFLPPNVKT